MQGVGSDQTGILVLAATNIPWVLDSGIRYIVSSNNSKNQSILHFPITGDDSKREFIFLFLRNPLASTYLNLVLVVLSTP